jgi:hypothetical protein
MFGQTASLNTSPAASLNISDDLQNFMEYSEELENEQVPL